MAKKLLILVLTLTCTAAVFLLPDQDAEALDCIRCMPGGTTPTVWGFGSTCAAAKADAVSQASAFITCTTCQETPIGVLPCDDTCSNPAQCFNPYGQWRVDLKVQYKCEQDVCF